MICHFERTGGEVEKSLELSDLSNSGLRETSLRGNRLAESQ
jgi:hypothetical protein